MSTCKTCVWYSDGFQAPKGSGYCYGEGDYHDPDDTCEFWRKSLREAPIDAAPGREPINDRP